MYQKNTCVTVLIKNFNFRIPQEKWHIYPAWLFLFIHDIIEPLVLLAAIATQILMKKEMNRYLWQLYMNTR